MKKYKIRYQDNNRISTIVLNGESLEDLKNDPKYPQNLISIQERRSYFNIEFSSSINIIQIMNELNIMLQAKLPLGESIELLIQSYERSSLEYNLLMNINNSINNGTPIHKGLENYRGRIPSIVINFFRLGERNSNMSQSIESLCVVLNKEKEYKEKLYEALIYPLVLIISMTIALSVIFIFVIPKFEYMFSQLGAQLPLVTQILLKIKGFMITKGIYMLIALFLTVGILLSLYKKGSTFKYKIDKILLNYIPYISSLLLAHNLHKLFMVLKQLTKSKYQFPIALDNTKVVINNSFMRNRLDLIYSCLENGDEISESFSKAGLFDELTIRLLLSGEKGNQIDMVLEKLESIYDKQLHIKMKSFIKLMEFILIGTIGSLILFIMLAIFLPVWQMSTVLN